MFACLILAFADVLGEVEKLVAVIEIVVDEFPVAPADGVRWFVTRAVVVWVSPVKGALGEGVISLTIDGRSNGSAVEVLGRQELLTSEFQQGGEDIHGDGGGGTDGWFDFSLPGNDGGYACASFVGPAFAGSERQVGCDTGVVSEVAVTAVV